MDNNFDANTMNNIKKMVDSGDISGAISQISPEMIQNFSKMVNQNNINTANTANTTSTTNSTYSESTTNSSSSSPNINNLDANTIAKITSAFSKMNNKNDPRSNLLYSLKPYLRDTRKEKLDQYVNLLNVSKIAEILKDDKKENS